MIDQPLNPQLYAMLKRRFRHVQVSGAGESMLTSRSVRYVGPLNTPTEGLCVDHPGEYYKVCCPFCSDTRYRLYINHRWGVRDELGNRNLWLAICYNELCINSWERREELWELVTALEGDRLERARIKPGKQVDLTKVKAEWPGPVTRVDRLSHDHDAYRYLVRDRGFDPQILGPFYNVHYCHDSWWFLARNRLIIPLYHKKVMRGWQARWPGELNWDAEDAPPKYWTMPHTPRSQLLYNFANARRHRTGVAVEGPMDVWGFGTPSMATLGDTMTFAQQKQITLAFRDDSFVLLYDPDALKKEKTQKLIRRLTGQFAKGLAVVELPGRDPGSFGFAGREFLRDYVAAEAQAQRVQVDWSKR